MNRLFLVLPIMTLVLSSCGGGSTARVHEKQRTPSDIKVSHLDLKNNTIDLRFNYRTYVERSLINIDCEISFVQGSQLKLVKQFDIQLGAFSTEILRIDAITISKLDNISDSQSLSYSLECEMGYDKGREYLFTDSVLHLVPASKFQYR